MRQPYRFVRLFGNQNLEGFRHLQEVREVTLSVNPGILDQRHDGTAVAPVYVVINEATEVNQSIFGK